MAAGLKPHLSRTFKVSNDPQLAELEQAIEDYVAQHNQNRRGFQWTKSADETLAKTTRARNVLDKTPSV